MANEAVCLLNLNSIEESNDFDENNGLILNDISVPIELIQRIMSHTEEKTLLNCQLVCKRWNETITEYVWRKKAEIKTGHRFSTDNILHWKDFYLICAKNLFKRNLLKNHSGEEDFQHWTLLEDDFVVQNNRHYSDSYDYDDSSDVDSSPNEDSDASMNSEVNIQIDDENGSDTNSEIDNDNESIDSGNVNNDDEQHEKNNSSDDSDESNGNVNHGDSEHDTDNNTDNESMLDVIEVDSENESNSNTGSHDDDTDQSDYITDHTGSDYDYDFDMNGWIVECPPIGVPHLPAQPEFEDKEHCFATTYYNCYKEQEIDLLKEGFSVNILDELRPPFEVNLFCLESFFFPI